MSGLGDESQKRPLAFSIATGYSSLFDSRHVFLESLVQWRPEAPASAAPREDQGKHGHSLPLLQQGGRGCFTEEEGEEKTFSHPWETCKMTFLQEFVQGNSLPPAPAPRSVNPFMDQEVTRKHQCEERGAAGGNARRECCILFNLALPTPNPFSVNVSLVKER